jgi:hypothetical protein
MVPSVRLTAMRRIQDFTRVLLWAAAVVLVATGTGRAADRVYPRPEAVEPLAIGTQVPSVRVETVRGEPVNLREVMGNRGALLVFYRGGW